MGVVHDADISRYEFPSLQGKPIKILLLSLAQAPNDEALTIPRVFTIPRMIFRTSNNLPRRGDNILRVLDPKVWIPVAIILVVAGLATGLVRLCHRGDNPTKDH